MACNKMVCPIQCYNSGTSMRTELTKYCLQDSDARHCCSSQPHSVCLCLSLSVYVYIYIHIYEGGLKSLQADVISTIDNIFD